jgi:type III secretion system chaperone SycN
MNWVNDTIREFGFSIGLPDLALNDRGRLDLDLPAHAKLRVTYLGDHPIPEVILSRGEVCHYPSLEILKKALQMSDFRHSSNWPTQTGISDQHLWISIRIPERAFVFNGLERAILELKMLHENLK